MELQRFILGINKTNTVRKKYLHKKHLTAEKIYDVALEFLGEIPLHTYKCLTLSVQVGIGKMRLSVTTNT